MGRTGVAIAANVLDDHEAEQAVGEAEMALGGLDVMVSIVGQALFTPLVDMTPEQWDSDQRRNMRYFFVAARLVAKSMIRRAVPGAMVCIASTDGIQGAPVPRVLWRGQGRADPSGEVDGGGMGDPRHPGQCRRPRQHHHAAPARNPRIPRGGQGEPDPDGTVRHHR
jgi:NAD(P)-dependent dehydrogenase (short-subunit alcohol dehydrogenase family)